MPETCRNIYDNKSQLLHQVGTSSHLLSYLTQFFLEYEMFHAKSVQMIKKHNLSIVMLVYEIHAVYAIT
jgi:hypothetical protein